MISALDEIDSIVRCIEAGAVDYLPKPFAPAILRARIRALAREQAAARPRARDDARRFRSPRSATRPCCCRSCRAPWSSASTTARRWWPTIFRKRTILFADIVNFTPFSGQSLALGRGRRAEPYLLRVRPAGRSVWRREDQDHRRRLHGGGRHPGAVRRPRRGRRAAVADDARNVRCDPQRDRCADPAPRSASISDLRSRA